MAKQKRKDIISLTSTVKNIDEIDSVLNKLYYSFDSTASFSTTNALYKAARKEVQNITLADVERWIQQQLAYTLHKPVKKRYKTRSVLVYHMDEQWQADLVDLSKLAKYNHGYKYLLVIIDVLSKYAWVRPLKSKYAKELKAALEDVFDKSKRQPQFIHTDKGTEFLNSAVKSLLRERKIKLITTESDRKASVVERLNRTLKGIMFKYFTYKDTRKYIDVLQDLVAKYNRSFHRSIKRPPKEVNKQKETLVWMTLYEKPLKQLRHISNKKEEFKVGDTVRISVKRDSFQKAYLQGWSEEIFIIRERLPGQPTCYKLKDQAGEDLKGMFYAAELQKVVEPSTYRIEKVIRKKRDPSGGLLYYVKWRGYPETFNSFVAAEDLKSS